jgi:hypothetical protein
VSRYSSLAPSASITSGTAAPTSTAKGIVVLDVDEEGYDPEVDARAYSAATEAWLDQRRLAALGEPDSNSEGANVISEPIHDLTSLDAERSKFIARTKHFVNELAIRPSKYFKLSYCVIFLVFVVTQNTLLFKICTVYDGRIALSCVGAAH